MSQTYLVYKHTSPLGKSYIGQTFDYQRRCDEHQRENKCSALFSAIKKYGWNNFKHEILKDGLTLDEANFWEKFYINKFNTISPNGYNIRTGGNNSLLHESTKIKIGNANRGKIRTLEAKLKMSKSSKGIAHSQETKEKIRKGNIGKIVSKETREKIRKAAIKKFENKETYNKCSKGFFKKGHIKTEAHRTAISKAAKERWIKYRENKI